MNNFYYQIIDMIFFTLPEFLFITSMVYIFLGRYDMLDIYKPLAILRNLIVPAIISEIVFVVLGNLGFNILKKIVAMLVFYIILTIIIRSNCYNNIPMLQLKLLGSVALGTFLSMGIETLCVVVLMLAPSLNIINILSTNSNLLAKIITALSWVMLELIIVVILHMKKNTKFLVILNIILKNKLLLKLCIMLISTDIIISFIMIRLVSIDKIFINVNVIEQIIVILGILLILPILMILFVNIIIIILLKKEAQLQQLYQGTDLDS